MILSPAHTDQRGRVSVEFAEGLQVTCAVVFNAAQHHPDLKGLHIHSARREILATDKLGRSRGRSQRLSYHRPTESHLYSQVDHVAFERVHGCVGSGAGVWKTQGDST